eukprot:5898901-Alexandrium_andersonii.AAC.1
MNPHRALTCACTPAQLCAHGRARKDLERWQTCSCAAPQPGTNVAVNRQMVERTAGLKTTNCGA